MANISEKNASAAKLNNEASGANGPKLTEQQAKDLQYFDRGNAANGELATQGDALTTAAIGDRGAARGRLDAALRSLPGGNSAIVNSLISPERQKQNSLAGSSSTPFFVKTVVRRLRILKLPNTVGLTYLKQGIRMGSSNRKSKHAAEQLKALRKGSVLGKFLLRQRPSQAGSILPVGAVQSAGFFRNTAREHCGRGCGASRWLCFYRS
ncbi:hypothetical protein [Pseudomonas sp. MWU16-30317]|uniref:hypothetical protein n=1 Tax=Pseudomonas sp. MWU16-30317 TaxID=2878095 RepID=UPI001CFB8B42|nr:hypothetical protein [Pseudomonas sp. MWU16-30317]